MRLPEGNIKGHSSQARTLVMNSNNQVNDVNNDNQPIEGPNDPTAPSSPGTSLYDISERAEVANEEQRSLHGSADKVPQHVDMETNQVSEPDQEGSIKDGVNQPGGMRYSLLMQTLKVFDSKFSGKEGENIDEWFHRLEFFVKPHGLSSEEKAYVLVNSVKGKAFSILTEGNSTNYEELKELLLREFRAPGAYMKFIQEFCNAKQGKNQKVSGFYHYLSKKMGRINDMAREKHKQEIALIHQDLATAVFLRGLENGKIRERLVTRSFDSLKDAYEMACLYEDAMKEVGHKRPASSDFEQRPNKKPFFKRETRTFKQGPVQPTTTRPQFSRDLSKVECFKCKRFGHYSRDCKTKVVGAVTIVDEEVELVKTTKSSTVLAQVGDIKMPVTIDSGADTNCISLKMVELAGVKEINKVRTPEVRFAGNTVGKPLGMATIKINFAKDSEFKEVKFLVFDELVPGCILGIDGQDQLKVRLDREQNFVWIDGVPIPLSQDSKEAEVRLGLVSVNEAFEDKLRKFESSKLNSDYMASAAHHDESVPYQLMSYELPESNLEDVRIESSLSAAEKAGIQSFLEESKGMFGFFEGKEKPISSVTTALRHKVITDGSIISAKPYRLSSGQFDLVKEEIDKMLTLGIIRPSKSPYASPVVLVPKPDKSWRFCIDYRKLNQHTKSDKYPLPNIDDCLSRMKGAKYFAKLDLAAGYWQIPMHEADIEKTAFVTPLGLYEFLVMPFGLKTAPATFQRMMDRLLGDLRQVMIYLDDVLIYAESITSLMDIMEEVFKRLNDANLKLRAKKCFIGMRKINYLGFTVGEHGIEADPDKVEVTRKMDPPRTVREVRRFIGMVSYYRNFIYQFAKVASPITALTKKENKFTWTKECQEAFDSLKKALCEAPVLAHPDPNTTYSIFTDASDVGLGAVLSQNGQPIWFASRVLTPAERKYDTREKECLAIIFGLDKYKP